MLELLIPHHLLTVPSLSIPDVPQWYWSLNKAYLFYGAVSLIVFMLTEIKHYESTIVIWIEKASYRKLRKRNCSQLLTLLRWSICFCLELLFQQFLCMVVIAVLKAPLFYSQQQSTINCLVDLLATQRILNGILLFFTIAKCKTLNAFTFNEQCFIGSVG